ncbi:FMN-binding negative transcriptional regulator [Enterovirga rhinocerotis]|uniref:PaiB family negative transcriptional regulator n=1 Tax=Enterovirga rhinocerotis TaxID=1339210 RepID=A0A4R7CCV4_9HYPH|nr:FMN-binding negative transcriptional regulator [Enterovirga rhinocerotis]TDR95016.1 PaiB family negative transcriptional regulator [Enterovirga rhinocerotis]
MYVPTVFRNEDRDLAWSLIETIRFGSLVSSGDVPFVSHVPFCLDRDRGGRTVLIGHMARGNAHWKSLDPGSRVLVTFVGPNSYISPSWYASSPRAPTWNYVGIHLVGTIEIVHDRNALDTMVRRLSREMEAPDSGWSIDGIDPGYVDHLLPGIVGFEITVSDVDMQVRLSQQNDDNDRRQVRQALADGGLRQRQVAEIMDRIVPVDRN